MWTPGVRDPGGPRQLRQRGGGGGWGWDQGPKRPQAAKAEGGGGVLEVGKGLHTLVGDQHGRELWAAVLTSAWLLTSLYISGSLFPIRQIEQQL